MIVLKNHRDNYTFLTQAPVKKVIFTLAVPTILSMLVTGVYNIATTFYVGHINNQATAAVGISFSFMAAIQAIGFTFGQGSGNYISRELGAKRHDNAARMAATGFVGSVATGALLGVLGLLFLHPLCRLLGSTPTILPYTEQYLVYVLLGAPFMTGSLTLNNQMRFQGNAAYAMYGIFAGALLNVALAPILIFGFHMGITGAGVATLAGQVTGMALLFYMTTKGGTIRIRMGNLSHTPQMLKEIFAGGTPSLTRQGMAAVSVALLNVAAGAYGDAAIAAMSIVGRIAYVVMAVIIGLGQGYQPVCGFCYGAHLYKRVKQGYWFIVRIGFYFLLACSLLGFVFTQPLIALFRNNAHVVAIGSVALQWQLATLPLGSVIMFTNMLMQTTRKPWRANILASARSGLFFIPLIILLPRRYGLLGVEMCQAWADVLSFIMAVVIARTAFRELKS